VTLVCAMWRVPRSTVYARCGDETGLNGAALQCPQTHDRAPGQEGSIPPRRGKRGPRTPLDDAALLAEIRAVLQASPFHTEGHRKVRVRLRPRGIRVGKQRVLRLMRGAQLLAPTRRRHVHGDRTHAGTIITRRPDELWGTDATTFYTRREGWCWFFGAIDHCAEDVVGWHVAKVGDRWAALEPIRQGVQRTHGQYAPKIALGLGLRMDWGPQYTAHQFLGELRWNTEIGDADRGILVRRPSIGIDASTAVREFIQEDISGKFAALAPAPPLRSVLAFRGRAQALP